MYGDAKEIEGEEVMTLRPVNTEHLTLRTTDAHFSRARDTSSTHMLAQDGHVFHRNLLGVLDPPPLFPPALVTESQLASIHGMVHALAEWLNRAPLHPERQGKQQLSVHTSKIPKEKDCT